MALICAYRLFFVDRQIADIVKEKKYQVRNAKIHHIMPGFGTTFGKAEAKVQDENGTVYSYDFALSGKIKREYKKNPETQFLLIKLDEKKEMYNITLPKEDNQEEVEEDE